jgi:uncharacterized protein
MRQPWPRVLIGVLVAVSVTTLLDAHHLSAFSALPLLPITVVLWRLDGFPRGAVGLAWGHAADYAWAVLYPVIIMAALTALAFATTDARVATVEWSKGLKNAATVGAATIGAALLTEEAFFRGWLWAALARCRLGTHAILVASSLAFALWHVSAVVLPTGFDLPRRQIPAFLANAFVLGVVWGLMRLRSGSIVVSSVSHGIWNGLAYSFFGFGLKTGALGLQHTAVFGPESGSIGLALNIAGAALFWRRWPPSA